jgi:hypothetical protein
MMDLLYDPVFLVFLLFLVIWEVVWRAIGLWHSARNNDKVWFVFILLFNTLGLLTLIYIFVVSQREHKQASSSKKVSKKK